MKLVNLIAIVVLIAMVILGCEQQSDKKITNLEHRVAALEASHREAEKQKQLEAAWTPVPELSNCIQAADAKYENFISLNSTKTGKSTVSTPQHAMQEARLVKHDAIEECKLLYGGH